MSNVQIAELVYGATALLYLALTYIEGERGGDQWPLHRVAGLVFCLFWPLLTVVFIYKFATSPSRPKFVFVDHALAIRSKPAARSPD
jgi:hypothetical protein